MSKEMEFFIYLIEHYADYKKIDGDEVMNKLKELNLIDKVFNGYEDIDRLIKEATQE